MGDMLLAVEIMLECGLACSSWGWDNHAYPGYGSGYFLVNDPFRYLLPQGVRWWQQRWRWSMAWPAALGVGHSMPTQGMGLSNIALSVTLSPIYLPRGYVAGSGDGTGVWLGLQHWGMGQPCLPRVRVWVLSCQ